MESRKLGKTDMSVSVLGFGGAEIGFNVNQTQEDVDLLLNSAIDSGLNLIDTAAAYHRSEEMIGKAVGHRRKEYYLATKCGALDGFTRHDWSKKGVLATIEQSLKLLRTDYLDLIQLHSCDAETLRQGDCMEGLERALERGYARYAGYSGDNEAAQYALGMDFFDTLQTSVSIADQAGIDAVIHSAGEQNVGVIAKRPIANAVWRHEEKPTESYHHEYWDRVEILRYEFLKKPLAVATATALRFTLSIPGISTAIVGTTRPERWSENAQYVADGALDEREFNAIRERWAEVSAPREWPQMT